MSWVFVPDSLIGTNQVIIKVSGTVGVPVPAGTDTVFDGSNLINAFNWVQTNGALPAPSQIGNFPFSWDVYLYLVGFGLSLFILAFSAGAAASLLRGR